ncbi:DNA polymerase sliding clamp [Halobacteriales archaeon QS_8_69_26]|nr:MAG: DNA polymerase sliding clamp [Halobacteriales archaeon QS_8_69_26]
MRTDGGTDGTDTALHAVVAADRLGTALSAVDALFEECHLTFDGEGIRMRAMDPATVAMVDLSIRDGAFESYEATDGHVGVAVDRLHEVVAVAGADDLVRLGLDPERRRLRVAIGELEYSLALIDPSAVRSPGEMDGVEFAAELVAQAETLDRSVRAANMVSDHVALGTDGEGFYVEAEGDTDDVVLERSGDDLPAFDAGETHSLFSLDYLTAIDRAVPRDREVTLRLGTEQPLGIEFEFADGAATAEYLVAPRIAAR